jgi:hypothetical protein
MKPTLKDALLIYGGTIAAAIGAGMIFRALWKLWGF